MPEEPTRFYETLITVRILSERPVEEPLGPASMGMLMDECNGGDLVGELVGHVSREVSPVHMAELLKDAGSEPNFFQLEDAVSLADLVYDSADDTGCDGDLVVVSKRSLNALLAGVGLHAQVFETEEEDD